MCFYPKTWSARVWDGAVRVRREDPHTDPMNSEQPTEKEARSLPEANTLSSSFLAALVRQLSYKQLIQEH